MFGRYKYLILILAVIVLLAPRTTLAVFGVGDFGLFDIPDQILGGLEEKTGPVFTAVIAIFVSYMAGLAALSLSGTYLQQFISQQDSMITALEPMTRAGWDFSAGLANMLLVLIFLIIAFAFIFKIETFQAQKALPKLILVALLINFSFLFVQMLIDLSQILYNTVLPEAPLISTVMEVLISPGESVIATVFAWFVALATAWAIPMANALAQILFSALFTVFILPNIIIWIIQAVFFWLLALMFFFFIFLFGARVFILQMLMILAPLAFLCLILPQTKSFWSQWFKTLLEWLLLGIFFLFFLVLGFGTLSLLTPSVDALPLPGVSTFKLGGFLVYYFVVFIYMAVILLAGKKFIPSGAQALIDFGKGIAGTVVARGLKPIGKSLKEKTAPQIKEDLAKSQRIQDFAKKHALAETPKLEGWRKLAAPAVAPWYALRRGAGRALGTGAIEGTKAMAAQSEEKAKKMEESTVASHLKGKMPLHEKIGYLNAKIKSNDIDKVRTEYGDDDKFDKLVAETYAQAKKMDMHKDIQSAFPHLIPDEDLKRSFKAHELDIPENQVTPAQISTVTDKNVEEERLQMMQKIRPDRAKQISKEVLAHEPTLKAIVKGWDGRQMGNFISQHGIKGIEAVGNQIKKDSGGRNPLEWLKDSSDKGGKNPALAKYIESQAGQQAGFSFEVPPETETAPAAPKEKITPGTEEEFRKAKATEEERRKRERP